MAGVVIIRAGQAGFSVESTLHREGYDGAITMVAKEPVAPYQRPPLSKAYLLGEPGKDRLMLRPDSYHEEYRISLRLGVQASTIDAPAKTVTVGDDVIA